MSSLCTPAANGCAHSPMPQAVFRALLAMAWTAGRSGGALLAPTTRASRSSLDPTKSPDLAPTKRLRRLGPRWRLLPSPSWTMRRRRDLQRCRPAKSVARAISPLRVAVTVRVGAVVPDERQLCNLTIFAFYLFSLGFTVRTTRPHPAAPARSVRPRRWRRPPPSGRSRPRPEAPVRHGSRSPFGTSSQRA